MALTGFGPTGWFTDATVQLAAPVAVVVAGHVWAEVPDPSVKVTGWLANGVLPDVRSPDSTTGCPFVVEFAPV